MAAALPPGPPQEAIVRHLLAAGADPTLRNLENEQPVHLLRPGPGPEGVSTGLTSELIGGPPTAPNTDLVPLHSSLRVTYVECSPPIIPTLRRLRQEE